MRLEQHLVLNRFMHRLLGASHLEDLKGGLYGMQEGPLASGQSAFYRYLSGRQGLDEGVSARLAEYDRRVMEYEARLARGRDGLHLRYFQYLALLYTEIYLDLLTTDPAGLLGRVNAYLASLQGTETHLRDIPPFAPDDLRRLAFFMATGSGKTLLMHAHLWQVLYYLQHGRHPEALVARADGRTAFQNILLITPGEGLSTQHLEELRRSGIQADHLSKRRQGQASLGPWVWVVEIHKLAEEVSGDGVSIALESLGEANLVLVDEGHKGTGSEAQTWKGRQKYLSSQGFLLEYSATFAQAIGAARAKDAQSLLAEYGRAILFDYSYRHFHDDGYGKAFRVLNLQQGTDRDAHRILVGGLLSFYQQVALYEENREAYRPYNLETPLWVFIGSSVSAVFTRARRPHSDVATVVAFLRHFLEDRAWAVSAIDRMRSGESGLWDAETGLDLFADAFPHLPEISAGDLYDRIVNKVFHGHGALEVWELKGADGEFGLRVSGPSTDAAQPYFGVISIGDSSQFKKHLREHLGLETHDDQFTPSLFGTLGHADSDVYVLVGSRKFIEGWDSWRVSTMGLLNIGKGQGSQVIQLFGRGVRLKGKNLSLKRSAFLPAGDHPEGLERLETLQIFGWNADYIQQFQHMMAQEGFVGERLLPVQQMDPWPELWVPVVQEGYDVKGETWTLECEPLPVTLDLTPRVGLYAGEAVTGAEARGVRAEWGRLMPLLDMGALYLDLLEYKQVRGYGNLYVDRRVLPDILQQCEVRMLGEDLRVPGRVQEAAASALRTYLDRFYTRRERAAESAHLEPRLLPQDHPNVVRQYTLRISDEALLTQIEGLLSSEDRLREGGSPLPRLHLQWHLYNPLLGQAGEGGQAPQVTSSPPGLKESEARFVEGMQGFWQAHHAVPPYDDLEVYLLRNLPMVGVGYFTKSGFYPDFILWVRNQETGKVRVVFVEPHGMGRGVVDNRDKIAAFRALRDLGEKSAFHQQGISLDGYILTDTPVAQMVGEDLSWVALENQHVLGFVESTYETLLLGS